MTDQQETTPSISYSKPVIEDGKVRGILYAEVSPVQHMTEREKLLEKSQLAIQVAVMFAGIAFGIIIGGWISHLLR